MPLLYIDHSRKRELEHEFRSLARQIEQLGELAGLQGGTPTIAIPPAADPIAGRIVVWAKKVDIYVPSPEEQLYTETYDVATITGAYTHLEVDCAVIQGVPQWGSGHKTRWYVKGSLPFYVWYHDGGDPPSYQQVASAQFYDWVTTGAGHYRPHALYTTAIYNGDMPYFPVNPVGAGDVLQLKWEIDLRGLSSIPSYLCYKVWLLGRYVLHDAALYRESCPLL